MIAMLQARRYNSLGGKFLDQGNLEGAEAQYRRAAERAANWSTPWYNLGLVYKRLHQWQDSLECNQKATALRADDRAAWWNLGIAATALQQWELARRAWKSAGIDVPEGEGELRMALGLIPVRLNPETSGEVVWCDRIDLARAVIRSVPLPEAGHRYGDLILTDGAANGYRMLNGREVPVFDELERLEPSRYLTFEVALEVSQPADMERLDQLVAQAELGMDNWSAMRWICRACSEGRPHAHHDGYPEADTGRVRVGFGAKSEVELNQLLSDWTVEDTRRVVLNIEKK